MSIKRFPSITVLAVILLLLSTITALALTANITQVAENTFNDVEVKVSGDHLVWTGYTGGIVRYPSLPNQHRHHNANYQ